MNDWLQFQNECTNNPLKEISDQCNNFSNFNVQNTNNIFNVSSIKKLKVILSNITEPVLMLVYYLNQNEYQIKNKITWK